ncbi:hypothetical protein O0Q50_18900 [Priestia aryabhattai]|uniref:Uncharacterized protein n=1 Tax=Priestia aryabhattai TaxID=412384 RepID=A0AAX6NBH9_PRIAR|nr:hypothetical protein [Priestia aryabhattai]MDU9693248.1 hypothetical protein [Priestia aryabhattai]
MGKKIKIIVSTAIILFLVGLASHNEITKGSIKKESVENKAIYQLHK